MSKDKGNKSVNKKTILRILKYIKRYRFLVVLSLICAAISVVLTLYAPIIMGHAVDRVVGPGKVDFTGLKGMLAKLVIVVVITAVAQWVMNVLNNMITYRVVNDVRTKAYEKLGSLLLSYVDSHTHGDIVSRIIADVDQFSDGLLMGFTQLFTGVMTIVGTLCFMLSINWIIAIVVVCITPVSLFVASFIAKRTYSMFRKQAEIKGELTSLVNEMVENQKVVTAFSMEDETCDRFQEVNGRLNVAGLQATFFSSITNPSTRFVNSLVYTGVGIIGAITAIKGFISVGQLTSFLNYANQYTKPFNEISGVVTELQNALASAARVFELIDEDPEAAEPAGAHELTDVHGEVDLKNVDFSYNKDVELIKNLNLNVKDGQRIAIVGPTGCGKSTVINLLMRFYDVDAGSISVDGYDIREVTRKSLRGNYGMVLQETWLKSGTIRDNIAYGRPDATDEEIIEAAKQSHAHSFIKRLPDGYNTYITEDGGNLSQGQKQLLCITRVMLDLPPMLILDEATSSIDTRTEIRIQRAFAKMMKGRTSFVVAHRLSTIKESDVILVMKDGHIIEQGNHESLLAKGGFYTNLYNSQFAR